MTHPDLESLAPSRHFTRRDLLQAAVGSAQDGWKRCPAGSKAHGVA